jgi:integrase
MASIHIQPNRPFFYCAFSIFDAGANSFRRVFRSTGILKDNKRKRDAQKICDTWQDAVSLARHDKLTEHEARKLIDRCASDVARHGRLSADAARKLVKPGIDDIMEAANLVPLESKTIRSWCEHWLETKEIEVDASSHVRYKRIIQRFLDFIGKEKSRRDVTALQADDIAKFRNREAKALSRGTAKLSVKVLRMCFGDAVKQGLLTVNPGASVKVLESNGESARRPFSPAEITRILRECGDDVEWRGLVLFGLYLGQRLGDLAKLTWRAINLETGEIAFTTQKTGRRMVLPLLQPLSDYLSSLAAGDDANALIFPNAASAERTGTLSNRFREILVEAGLVAPRTHESTGKGRSSSRQPSELSFHSLRHSTATFLRAAGVSDFVAREILGHDSAAIARLYTHLTTDDLRSAMRRMPDVTAAAAAPRMSRAALKKRPRK